MSQPLLQVENLGVCFHTDNGTVNAVNGVSFQLEAGETLGIVGESGSGKSVTNLAIMGLIPSPPGEITSGEVRFRGEDLLTMNNRQIREIRGNKIAMIFQDPMTALNPFLTVEEQLTEVTQLHLGHSRGEARTHAIDMLEKVGIPAASRRIDEYPHQFSGGMRQRVMIAMALSCKPDILIADEPTTALDVTIQAQILELMSELQQQEGTAIIFITHDLGVVANTCHRVMVMYAGKPVEKATTREIFANPHHPYTLGLLNSALRWDESHGGMLRAIPGQPPDLTRLGNGCAFAPRCEFCIDECKSVVPLLVSLDTDSPESDSSDTDNSDASASREHACIRDLPSLRKSEVDA